MRLEHYYALPSCFVQQHPKKFYVVTMSRLTPTNCEELFPSDEEGSVQGAAPQPQVPVRKAKRSRASGSAEQLKSSASHSSVVSPAAKHSKKVKINPISKPQTTAADLFGSDSDDEDEPLPQSSTATVPLIHCAAPNDVLIHCDKCKVEIPKQKYKSHMRTNIHKSNCLLKTELKNIEIIATAFRNRICTYRLSQASEAECITPEAFLSVNQSDVVKLIEMSVLKHNCIKINFELFAYFFLPKSDEQQLKSFNTKYINVYKNTDLNELYINMVNTLQRKLTEFNQQESGWSFMSVSHLEINLNKYCPLRGGSYIALPPAVKNTKSCLNLQNNDNHCFLWSIIAHLFPTKSNVCRTSSYPHYKDTLNIEGMKFPPCLSDIKLFEKNNPNISINIYSLDKQCCVTGPLYMSTSKKNNHVNLLYFERGGLGHYCLIKDLIKLVRRQITHHKGKVFLCDACLQFFSSENKYTSHDCSKLLTILPEKNSTIRFKNYDRQQRIKFIIYADFESILKDCPIKNTSENTQNLKVHEPSCFAYYVCCSYDSTLNKYVTYRGSDCVHVFIKLLFEDIQYIHSILSKNRPMKQLTVEQSNEYMNATTCHICKHLLLDDKVRDHDHVTSEYRGAAHSHCNLMYTMCSFIPVVFHNLSGYDCHLFIKELAMYNGPMKIIPKTKEKYMSIMKFIKSKDDTESIQIKFIDSYQFLSSSLDELCKNLNLEDFTNLLREFSNKKGLELLRKKGYYPYEYVDSWSKYDENFIPSKECFYNTLKDENITDVEYEHVKAVWHEFNIKSLGEYTDLYLKCDVLLLCDIFEKFRNTSLQHYSLDPAYYVSAPSLSWDAMLLCTGVTLELIYDLEIYQLLEKGIRGGLAQCTLRHAKANNKYLPNYQDTKPSSYLVYLDCNNLYGYAMRKRMPVSEFQLLSNIEISSFDVMKISDDADYGYILEVDLSYPEKYHNAHSDLPFAQEKFIPPGGKTKKLIANLYDKYHYVIHYVHLKQCLTHGLILKKIHRVIKFRQDDFLQKYIDLNTHLRQESTSQFQRDFFKLLNNAVFGKTIENKRKQANVKLITQWNDTSNRTNKCVGAEKLIAQPNLKSVSIFSENFVAIQLNPDKILLDKPIYIGFTVLEYAKQHLYQFHYEFIRKKYNERAKLCYTDTDSLLYLIETENIYEDMIKNITEFDTSNFAEDNPYGIPQVNAKVPGLFKDELGGSVISEFVGLRAKLYCLKSVKTTLKKAKGITKPVTKKLQLGNYSEALYNNKTIRHKMNIIRSIKHVLYSQQVNKIVLNGNDDKRQILSNRTDTLPWGHCNTIS